MIIVKIFKWLFIIVFCFTLGFCLFGTVEKALMTEQEFKESIDRRKARIKELEKQSWVEYEARKRGERK